MQASGLGPRPLGRLLGVSPYRVREWRRGVVPSSHYLYRLLTTAEGLGLGHILPAQDVHVGMGCGGSPSGLGVSALGNGLGSVRSLARTDRHNLGVSRHGQQGDML